MVALELKLTKKVASDKEGARPPLPRIAVGRIPAVEPRRFHAMSVEIGLMTTLEVVRVVLRWRRTEDRQNHTTNKCRGRIRARNARNLTGKSRMSAYKERVAETERVKERTRAGEGSVENVREWNADGGSTCGRIWRK